MEDVYSINNISGPNQRSKTQQRGVGTGTHRSSRASHTCFFDSGHTFAVDLIPPQQPRKNDIQALATLVKYSAKSHTGNMSVQTL